MADSVASRNAATDARAALGRWCSLHTADPGTTGASEVAGSTRAQTTYPASSGGSATGSPASVQVPAGGPYTHWGVWTASSGGTFITGGILSAPVTYGVPGTYDLTVTLSS